MNVIPTSRRVRVGAAGVLAAAIAALGVPALSGTSTASTPASASAADGEADWTMMVYAVGDTSNVSQLMVENLAQLAQLPEMPNVNVVVLIDLPERSDPGAPVSTLPGMGQFTTAKLLELEAGGYREIRDYGEISMGRTDVLSGFIAEAARLYPAEKYGLTLFDHGGGNTGGYVDTGPPGVESLTIPEMRNGMVSGMQQAGIDRFEIVNHAACLMANYETASAMAPLTKTLVGSEEIMIQYPLSPQGFPPLGENRSGDEVGAAFIDGYRRLLDQIAAQSPGDQTYRDMAAMSVIDEDKQLILDRAIESFSQAAVAHMDEIATQVARARADALEFVIGFPGGGGSSWDLVDLGDFLRHLEDVPDEVAVARDAAFAALDAAVTHQVTGQATQQATGLNVYLPTNPAAVGDYLTDGTAPPGWAAFVRAFIEQGVSGGGGSAGDGDFGFVDENATVLQADAGGIKIAGQLGSGDAAEVTASETQIYTQMGNRQGALAMVFPAYVNAGGEGQVQGVWNYSLTTLTDGQRVIPVTAGYQAQSGGLVGSFLAQYTSPAGARSDIGVRLLLSSEGQIQSVTVVDVSNGTGGGVSLELGGTLTPYLFVRSSGSFVKELSSQSIGITSNLAVGFSRLPQGTTFEMGVVVVNVAGDVSSAFVNEQVR